uniref:Uncharacterized protein n=1 Tax=Acrobeloides nanus TaxID=290746 RepID=A0A914C5X1_9BILA
MQEDATNYVGLIIISLPMDVQILNAIVLLATNKVIRKGMVQLIIGRHDNAQAFITAIGMPTKTKTQWGTTRSTRGAVKGPVQ